MIYPTLYIDQTNNQTLVNIFNTDFDNEDPVLSIKGNGETFLVLTNLFLNQYTLGFDKGYEVGFDDAEWGDIMYGKTYD